MSFLFPTFLIGALAAAIPIVLHLRSRPRLPEERFSDVRFIRASRVRHRARWRLRELLLLAARVTALVLLAGAFARPILDAPAASNTILVIDRSLSMSAPGQLDRARQIARDVVGSRPAGERVAVIAFDDRADILQALTPSRPLVHAAIDRVDVTPGGTRYAAGLHAAADLLAADAGHVVLITDGQRAGWDDGIRIPLAAASTVEVRAVPAVAGNLAVTAVDAGPGPPAGGVSRALVTATLRNTGSASVETVVTVSVDRRGVVQETVVIEPGTSRRRWDLDVDGDIVAVSLRDDAGYRGDDARHAWLAGFDATRVLLVAGGREVGAGAFYVDQALRIAPAGRPFEVRAVVPAAVTALTDDRWRGVAATVVLSTIGLGAGGARRLADFVRAGGGLLLTLGPEVDPASVARALDVGGLDDAADRGAAASPDGRRLVVTDGRHQIMRALGATRTALSQARFTGVFRLDVGRAPGVRTLARFDDGLAALAELDVAPGRALVWASDLNNQWNDLPRRRTFVPFVHEAVRYLAGPPAPRREVVVADVPVRPPVQPGVWTEPTTGEQVVVNTDPRESVPDPVPVDELSGRLADAVVPITPPPPGESSVPVASAASPGLWWYLMAAVVVVLVGESWLAWAPKP